MGFRLNIVKVSYFLIFIRLRLLVSKFYKYNYLFKAVNIVHFMDYVYLFFRKRFTNLNQYCMM